VEPLIKCLKDPYDDVREAAAWALGHLGDPRAWNPLTEALKDKSQRVEKAAAQALKALAKSSRGKHAITIA
jgi:HEAT repeat protein